MKDNPQAADQFTARVAHLLTELVGVSPMVRRSTEDHSIARQLLVLVLGEMGYSMTQIARRIGITSRGVRYRVMKATDAERRLAAGIALAALNGESTPSPDLTASYLSWRVRHREVPKQKRGRRDHPGTTRAGNLAVPGA